MPLKEIIFLGNLLEFPKTFSTLNSNAVAYGFEIHVISANRTSPQLFLGFLSQKLLMTVFKVIMLFALATKPVIQLGFIITKH